MDEQELREIGYILSEEDTDYEALYSVSEIQYEER